MRILIAALLVPCALASLVGLLLLWPTGGPPATTQPGTQQPVKAQVSATRATDCSPGAGDGGYLRFLVPNSPYTYTLLWQEQGMLPQPVCHVQVGFGGRVALTP